MRFPLKSWFGSFVHCSGWIVDWGHTRSTHHCRVCIAKVAVKKVDRMLTFDKQKTICKLDHINIFCDLTSKPIYDLAKYQRIAFSGHVIQYTRKDGSIDYGIQQVSQPSFCMMLNLVEYNLKLLCAPNALNMIENYFLLIDAVDSLVSLQSDIEEMGDRLSTFEFNYNEYKVRISTLLTGLRSAIQKIRMICGNRRMRRSGKISKELAAKIMSSPLLQ
jgi:hypothetical protein